MNTRIHHLGRWLFRHRSFSPLPVIVLVLVCFPPRHFGALQPWVTAVAVLTAFLGAVSYTHLTLPTNREV